MVWPTLRVFRSQSRLTFLVLALVLLDSVVAPQRRVIPTGCRDELQRSHRQVDALRRVDDLHSFVAFRKMTEFHAGRAIVPLVLNRQGGESPAGRTESAPPL